MTPACPEDTDPNMRFVSARRPDRHIHRHFAEGVADRSALLNGLRSMLKLSRVGVGIHFGAHFDRVKAAAPVAFAAYEL